MNGLFRLAALSLTLLLLTACAAEPVKNPVVDSSEDLYGAPLPEFSSPVTLEELRMAFYRYSVVSIVKALHEGNEFNWNYLLNKVREGDADWTYALRTYVAPGADAGAATDVLITYATALPNNPQAILQLNLGRGDSLARVCNLPFIEPEYEFVRNYGEKTLAALQSVEEDYLLESRDLCARYLRESLDKAEAIWRSGRWVY